MNFNQALEQIAPKLALCGTKEEVIGLVRPLLVRAYRDGKRFMLHEAMLKKCETAGKILDAQPVPEEGRQLA